MQQHHGLPVETFDVQDAGSAVPQAKEHSRRESVAGASRDAARGRPARAACTPCPLPPGAPSHTPSLPPCAPVAGKQALVQAEGQGLVLGDQNAPKQNVRGQRRLHAHACAHCNKWGGAMQPGQSATSACGGESSAQAEGAAPAQREVARHSWSSHALWLRGPGSAADWALASWQTSLPALPDRKSVV